MNCQRVHQEAVKIVNTCNQCRISGTECITSPNRMRVLVVQLTTFFCEGFDILALVCDMSNDHTAVEDKVSEIIPVVYGIYHVTKAITNSICNNTAMLKDSYFSAVSKPY